MSAALDGLKMFLFSIARDAESSTSSFPIMAAISL